MQTAEKNRPSPLVQALFKLSRQNAIQIGQQSNLSKSNLYDAMAGRRGIPTAKQQLLESALGLLNGYPNPDIVHYWQVGVDLSDLKVAINFFFPNGAVIGGIWRQGSIPFNFKRVFDKQQFAIYDDRTLVILMRKGIGTHMLTAEKIGPESIQRLMWRGGKVGSDTMIAVDKALLHTLEKSTFQDTNTLRQIFACEPKITWETVTEYLKQNWQSPQDAFDTLMQLAEK